MPATALPGCYGARNLVAIRASRLDAAGIPTCRGAGMAVDSGSAYMFGGPVSFTATRNVDAGATDTQRDGDGNVCNTRTTPDTVVGISGTLVLCQVDFQLIELLTGARILNDATFDHGIEEAAPANTPPRVEFNVWSRSWAGASQSADPYSYLRGTFFNTQWRLGDNAFQENALEIPLTFTGEANLNIGIGSFDDLPAGIVGDGFSALYQVALADVPDPTAAPYSDNSLTCGYVDTPICT